MTATPTPRPPQRPVRSSGPGSQDDFYPFRMRSQLEEEDRLRAENRLLKRQALLLQERLAEQQAANERAYANDYDRSPGPGLDPAQPFGTEPPRKLGTVPVKPKPRAWTPRGLV